MSEPWEDPNSIWKTKAQYFTWLRGAIRRIWADYPLRKQWKKNSLRPVTKQEKLDKVYHPSTKNVGQCVNCLEWMAGSKLECDHKLPSNGCRSLEEAKEFLLYCGATTSDMFQLSCKPCHKIKTLSEKLGITFNEAKIEKEAITFSKLSIGEQLDTLVSLGYSGPSVSNAKKRRQTYTTHLKSLEE